jgi:hypothetical protein
VISLAGTTANFLATASNVDPAQQQIGVSNSGGGSLTGLSAGVTYNDASSGWLGASVASTAPLSPSSTPLTLTVTTGSIAPGTYSATVTVSSTLAGVSAKQVTVTFTRQASLANDVWPNIFNGVGCDGCHTSGAGAGYDFVDLSSPSASSASLVNIAPTVSVGGFPYRVNPGDSTSSWIWVQLSAQTTAHGVPNENMPQGCPENGLNGAGCLTSAQEHLVAMWIQQGANP